MAAKNYRTMFWFIYICLYSAVFMQLLTVLYMYIYTVQYRYLCLLYMFYIESYWHKALGEGRGHCIRYLHFRFTLFYVHCCPVACIGFQFNSPPPPSD